MRLAPIEEQAANARQMSHFVRHRVSHEGGPFLDQERTSSQSVDKHDSG
jgi:hypothetical protein